MSADRPHILLLEPYYGGSHRAFIRGLRNHIPFKFTLVSLPARKWKMRMQLAAPWMAEQVVQLTEQGEQFDAILCSTFIDVATLKAVLAGKGIILPVGVYFHENQFAYPNQLDDPAFYQFTALNFTTALAADAIAFNSAYNLDTFMDGIEEYLRKAADMDVSFAADELRNKAIVLYPGLDFSDFDQYTMEEPENELPVVVWNHRWEHDKDPHTFFRTMMDLSRNGKQFRLIVAGQQFERCHEIFSRAEQVLQNHILHFGYARKREEYIRLLQQGDIIVSTAEHEFFGMAVLEGVRCGCRPLVPDRLSYRELFPPEFRYPENGFARAIASFLDQPEPLDRREAMKLTEGFAWPRITDSYERWFYSWL